MAKKIVCILIAFLLIAQCGCAVQQAPLTVAELLSLGEKYLSELDYEQALVQFLKVIEIEPMNPRGYTGAAEAYEGLGDPQKAAEILERGGLQRNDSQSSASSANPSSQGQPNTAEDPLSDEEKKLLDQLTELAMAYDYWGVFTFLETNYEDLMNIETTAMFMGSMTYENHLGEFYYSKDGNLSLHYNLQKNRDDLVLTIIYTHRDDRFSGMSMGYYNCVNSLAEGKYVAIEIRDLFGVDHRNYDYEITIESGLAIQGLPHGEEIIEILGDGKEVYRAYRQYIYGLLQPLGLPSDGDERFQRTEKAFSKYEMRTRIEEIDSDLWTTIHTAGWLGATTHYSSDEEKQQAWQNREELLALEQ